MSASLVGSEMCIRDRRLSAPGAAAATTAATVCATIAAFRPLESFEPRWQRAQRPQPPQRDGPQQQPLPRLGRWLLGRLPHHAQVRFRVRGPGGDVPIPP
eukprot:6965120-Alexandrium_andersonii.AAC.1